MSWGSSQNTNQTSTNSGQGAQAAFSAPQQLPWVSSLQELNGQAAQQQLARASRPVYGDAQKAAFIESQNAQTNAGESKLASVLSGKGILDSGAFSGGVTGLEAGRQGNLSGFFSQLPFQEQAAQANNQKNALGMSIAAAAAPPTGQLSGSTSNSQNTSDSKSQTTTDPGISGLVSSIAGLGFGALTGGLGSMMGGGSFGSGFGQALGGGGGPAGGGNGGGGWSNPVGNDNWYQQAWYPSVQPGGSAPYQSMQQWQQTMPMFGSTQY